MVGFARHCEEANADLFGSAVTFAVVTGNASGNEVFPGVLSTPRPRNNMIQRKRMRLRATVLTTKRITTKDVFSTEVDLFIGHANEGLQANNARVWQHLTNGVNSGAVATFHHFSFGEEHEHDGFANAANRYRLIGLIKHKNFSAERIVAQYALRASLHLMCRRGHFLRQNVCAEDSLLLWCPKPLGYNVKYY